jgi:acyl dehydratase
VGVDDLVTDLTAIQAGYQFPSQVLNLDPETVAAYVSAVDDPYPGYRGKGAVVPPLAVLALAMRGLADLLAAHAGALHLTQQLTALRTVPVGSRVTARLSVQNRSERRGFAALTLEVSMELDEAVALQGSMLLMVPLASGGTANG